MEAFGLFLDVKKKVGGDRVRRCGRQDRNYAPLGSSLDEGRREFILTVPLFSLSAIRATITMFFLCQRMHTTRCHDDKYDKEDR